MLNPGKNTCLSSTCKLYVEVAIDVFKTQDINLLTSLKNFLIGLPEGVHIEAIFMTALDQLASHDLKACDWLLKHSNRLLPEIDFASYALTVVQGKLQSKGFLMNRDFTLGSDNQLYLSQAAKESLMESCSECDRCLLEGTLQIVSYL